MGVADRTDQRQDSLVRQALREADRVQVEPLPLWWNSCPSQTSLDQMPYSSARRWHEAAAVGEQPTKRLSSCRHATMLPATSPSTMTVWTHPVGLPSTFVRQCIRNRSRSRVETAPAVLALPLAEHLDVRIVDVAQQHIGHADSSAGKSVSSVILNSAPGPTDSWTPLRPPRTCLLPEIPLAHGPRGRMRPVRIRRRIEP